MSTRTKIEPVLVEVSLRNAIARRLREHGVPDFDTIAGEVVTELTGEPVVAPPKGVPLQFTIEGVRLVWPRGLDTRVPTAHERDPFNKALSKGVSNDRMTDEDNVRVLRTCYIALWKRACIKANERVHEISEPTHEGCTELTCPQHGPANREPSGPVVTTSMLEGRNPVLEAKVVVTPKKRAPRKPKVEPVVSTDDTLTTLQDDLASLRKTLEGAS